MPIQGGKQGQKKLVNLEHQKSKNRFRNTINLPLGGWSKYSFSWVSDKDTKGATLSMHKFWNKHLLKFSGVIFFSK